MIKMGDDFIIFGIIDPLIRCIQSNGIPIMFAEAITAIRIKTVTKWIKQNTLLVAIEIQKTVLYKTRNECSSIVRRSPGTLLKTHTYDLNVV